MTELTRTQVIAHRIHAHGLVQRAAELGEVAVLELGVQNSPPGALPVALSARLAQPLAPDADLTAGGALTLVWSHRGAPHLHRSADLPALAGACWPRDDADAAARLGWQRARLAEVGGAARAAYATVAGAVSAVLDRPMVKGELSAELTARLPAELSPFCGGCGVHHVGEQLLRVAALAGGARLQPNTKPLVLEPIPAWPGPPAGAGTAELQESYLRFCAPASDADVAVFLGTSRAAAAPDRPVDLVPVRVDGRAAAIPAAQLDAVRIAAAPAGLVRLLPPSDPLLACRDREVLVPDPARRKALWPAMGAPGAVLSGVDVVGLWRTRVRGRRLEITVAGFRPLTGAERTALDEEAHRLAVVRGTTGVEVSLDVS